MTLDVCELLFKSIDLSVEFFLAFANQMRQGHHLRLNLWLK